MIRGFFEIGVYKPKTEENIGTLWRTAFQLGAFGIFVIGKRYKKQCSDTCKAYKHIPLKQYEDIDNFLKCRTYNCPLIAIEQNGTPLKDFDHPKSAIYLLGAEDFGLPEEIINKCQNVVSLNSVNANSYNVSTAGSLVMYDRVFTKV